MDLLDEVVEHSHIVSAIEARPGNRATDETRTSGNENGFCHARLQILNQTRNNLTVPFAPEEAAMSVRDSIESRSLAGCAKQSALLRFSPDKLRMFIFVPRRK